MPRDDIGNMTTPHSKKVGSSLIPCYFVFQNGLKAKNPNNTKNPTASASNCENKLVMVG